MTHLGLVNKSPSFQNLLKRSLPPQKHAGQHETAGEEDVNLTSQNPPSYPKDSFFSTLQWLDNTDSSQDASQIIKESVQIISQQTGFKQPLEHATHSSSSVCICFYYNL